MLCSAQKWMQFSISVQFNVSTVSSIEPLSTTPGEIDIRPRGIFYPKFDAEKLLFEASFFE